MSSHEIGGVVLARKLGETVHIGENIIIKVVQLKNKEVKFKVYAPRDVPIDRGEVAMRKEEERKYAARNVE